MTIMQVSDYSIIFKHDVFNGVSRLIRLEFDVSSPLEPSNVHIQFVYDDQPTIGRIRNEGRSFLVQMPVSEFNDIYHMLQSEKPLFFNWFTADDQETLTKFSLSTSEEPIGEGVVDSSQLST